jgi:hypothetical protein
MVGYVIIPMMINTVSPYVRKLNISLCSLSLLFLSACQAGSEPSRLRWSEPAFAGIVESRRLGELSGLARSQSHPGIFWAINDGANPEAVKMGSRATEIFAIDAQGKILATLNIAGVDNIDWEDISSYRWRGKNYLAIADTGDNGGVRRDLYIHIIAEPDKLTANMSVSPTRTIRFQWSDGARDVESLFTATANDSFYLVSKKRVPAELFSLPIEARDGSHPKLIGTFEGIEQPDAATMNTKGDYGRYRSQITGADLSPDGRLIALLNYQQVTFFNMPDKHGLALKPIMHLVLPWLPQAEGIAFSSDGQSILIGGEQAPAPLIRFDRTPETSP